MQNPPPPPRIETGGIGSADNPVNSETDLTINKGGKGVHAVDETATFSMSAEVKQIIHTSGNNKGIFKITDNNREFFIKRVIKGRSSEEEIANTNAAMRYFDETNNKILGSVRIYPQEDAMMAAKQLDLGSPNDFEFIMTEGTQGIPIGTLVENFEEVLASRAGGMKVKPRINQELFDSALKGKKITQNEAKTLIDELQRMNNAGITHGDIKGNLMLYRDSGGNLRAKLIDFGSNAASAMGVGGDDLRVRSIMKMFEEVGIAEKNSILGILK